MPSAMLVLMGFFPGLGGAPPSAPAAGWIEAGRGHTWVEPFRDNTWVEAGRGDTWVEPAG